MKGAKGLLISITGGKDLTLFEVDEAATRIREEVDTDANIILGATFDDNLDGIIRVSVVATGIDKDKNTEQKQDIDKNKDKENFKFISPKNNTQSISSSNLQEYCYDYFTNNNTNGNISDNLDKYDLNSQKKSFIYEKKIDNNENDQQYLIEKKENYQLDINSNNNSTYRGRNIF